MTQHEDAFAGGDRTPALSTRGSKPGDSWALKVTGPAKLVHSRDFDSGEPAFWDAEKTQPKMAAVVPATHEGEAVSVWATKPSSMFSAIAAAQTAAKAQLAAGGTLVITHEDDEPNKDRKKNPRKIYKAVYTPPSAFADGDAPF